MLKLTRNMLEAYGLLESAEGCIYWMHIQDLQKLQATIGLRAANKLSENHVRFKNQIMKVSLAAQVLSESVGAALKLAKQINIPGFQDSLGTAKFVEVISQLFDVMNSRNLKCRGLKKPFMAENQQSMFKFLLDAKDYLLSLKVPDGTFIHSTWRHMSVVGFLVNIESLLNMIPELLIVQPFVLTYRFSQDHLELFFSAVRNAGGASNNPTCRQFTYVFRRLLVNAGVKAGRGSNVSHMDQTVCLPVRQNTQLLIGRNTADIASPFVLFKDVKGDHSYSACLTASNQAFVNNIVVYIASFVVRKVYCRIACDICRASLLSETSRQGVGHYYESMYHLLELKDKGGLVVPSHGTVLLLLAAEKALRRMQNVTSAVSICQQKDVRQSVKREYGRLDPLNLGQHIIESQSGIYNHFYDLIEVLITVYFDLRQNHVAKVHSSGMKATSVRQKLNKFVLFKGD